MDQERDDYAEEERTGRARRIDWEHGMAPVWLFVLVACVVVFGMFSLDDLREFIWFIRRGL